MGRTLAAFTALLVLEGTACSVALDFGEFVVRDAAADARPFDAGDASSASDSGPAPDAPCVPSGEEDCDGVDDDCDGLTDEGLLGTPDNCGRCGRSCGATACDEGACRNAATEIVAGESHVCALIGDPMARTVSCWGSNDSGQLGDGTTDERAMPVDTGLSGVLQVAGGNLHTCATTNSRIYCWGWNAAGQLGDGTMITRLLPTQVVATFSGPYVVATGHKHTCALDGGGAEGFCWGANEDGQLGAATAIAASADPLVWADASERVYARVSTGRAHTCAVEIGGAIWCWGANAFGQLGDGTSSASPAPVMVSRTPELVVDLVASLDFSCAVTLVGEAWCWGLNWLGELGDGTTTPRSTPVHVMVPGDPRLTQISAGGQHACAVTSDGDLWCWGGNQMGELGIAPDDVPHPARLVMSGVAMVAAGGQFTCALLDPSHEVMCWGDNSHGQLGRGATGAADPIPALVPGLP